MSASLEYLAGFFDGEACIRGTLQSSGFVVVSINISLKNPVPLVKLKDKFGVGTIALYPNMPPYKYYTFTAYSKNARTILEGLLPYLVVKKEEAELALEAISLTSKPNISRDDYERLAQISDQLKNIKRRLPTEQEILPFRVDVAV